MLLPEEIEIWREAQGDYHVEWRVSAPDTKVTVAPVLAHDSATIHHDEEASRARLSGLPLASRHFFELTDQHGTRAVATERRLGMHGAPNFRDFGGYQTADGRSVKWGYLFRSGQLSNLSEHDVALLETLQLDLVCDFRRVEEQESDPSRLPSANTPRIISLPIIPGSNSRFFEEADAHLAGPEVMYDFMVEINHDFALAQNETYARMFKEILAVPDSRFLVHCAAGKDRTGFAAAIVLLALGVPRATIMRDYLLTRRFFLPEREIERLQEKYEMEHMNAEVIVPMLEVHEAYLAQALDAIDREYPSLEAYLADALNVGPAEISELRARYLE
ncbi:MAG: tyrosine-protein phosphatase [Halioglobus sp.]